MSSGQLLPHDLVLWYSFWEKVTVVASSWVAVGIIYAGQPCSAGLAPVSPAAVGCSCYLGPWHQFAQQQRHADYGSLTAVYVHLVAGRHEKLL